jgi:MoaA/NifB/PqqE/SkfB family radical SAM enzyme
MEVAARVKQFAAVRSAKAILKILPHVSEQRLLQFSLVQKGLAAVSYYPEGRDFLRSLLLQFRRSIPGFSKNCFHKFAENLLVNEFLTAAPKRDRFKARYGFYPPFFLVISPTMRCNLNCFGCYAGDYDKQEELSSALLHRLLQEAKEMGIYFITISGGEPFMKEDLLDLMAAHSDIYFQVYTNGTLIDEKVARTLSQMGNVLPALSVEGWEKATDARRGPGSFKKILAAMDRLRQAGIPFGFSATATRQNNELISSDEFVKFWIDRGCFIGWYFNYLPIGKKPDLSLMPSPEQRIDRRKRLIEMRLHLPIILADFWNDGPLVGACIAGDRYVHITANGSVEPCVFVHFARDNIKEKSLAEILASQFFHSIRRRQPYSVNYYRPCMAIDHPHILREVVSQSGAHPTHPGAEGILTEFADDLDRYAMVYGKLADALWSEQIPESAPLERRPYGELGKRVK